MTNPKSSDLEVLESGATEELSILYRAILRDPKETAVYRYLHLWSQQQDSPQKVEKAIQLAERLVDKKPRIAMQVANMVFQHDGHNVEALRVIISSLNHVGKLGPATVIKQELERIESLDDFQTKTQAQIPEAHKVEDWFLAEKKPDEAQTSIEFVENLQNTVSNLVVSMTQQSGKESTEHFYQKIRKQLSATRLDPMLLQNEVAKRSANPSVEPACSKAIPETELEYLVETLQPLELERGYQFIAAHRDQFGPEWAWKLGRRVYTDLCQDLNATMADFDSQWWWLLFDSELEREIPHICHYALYRRIVEDRKISLAAVALRLPTLFQKLQSKIPDWKVADGREALIQVLNQQPEVLPSVVLS